MIRWTDMISRRIISSCTLRLCWFRSISSSTQPIKEKLSISLLPQYEVDTETVPTSLTRAKIDRGDRQQTNSLPPTLQYVRDIMDKYEDHIVITQIGSFYELYFEHATIYAPKLNITLTCKELTTGRVAFAGFPLHQLYRHLKVLVKDHGYSVAISDQFKTDTIVKNDKNRFLRRVTRIVTPGTFIDEAFENLQENQFLLNIEFPENCFKKLPDVNTQIGLCWCDISTGELFVQLVCLKDLVSSITRIRPREILLDESVLPSKISDGVWYPELIELKKYFVKYQKLPSKHRTIGSFKKLFASGDDGKDFDLLIETLSQKEIAAFRNTLLYIEEHLPDMNTNLQLPKKQLTADIVQIDSRTSAALELHTTMRENHKKGSLLSTIRRTVTPSGTRLLTQWLSAPSMNIDEIKKRQTFVKLFKSNYTSTETLISFLKMTADMTRILQRFSFGKGEPVELIQLSHSLKQCKEISYFLENSFDFPNKKVSKIVRELGDGLRFTDPIVDDVLNSLNEEILLKQSNTMSNKDSKDDSEDEVFNSSIWMVKPEASIKLLEYHQTYQSLVKEKEDLLKWYSDWFQEHFKLRNIMLKRKKSGEFCIHLSGTPNNLNELDEYIKDKSKNEGAKFRILQKSAQTRWISHDRWAELSEKMEVISLLIQTEQGRVFANFQKKFVQLSSHIRVISQTLDYLDVLSSFAKLATEQRLVVPKITKGTELKVVGGRHLVVEAGLSQKSMDKFVSNDCTLDSGNLWVITGPNMGGKSTFLRQNAIIVILAQVGSFVPCEKAEIGLVDKIFSRVGSADDLYNEMSTFMVEMIETSFILKGATERSLAILDEIGRGTSRSEGVAIAYATLKYLVEKNRCRTLFATHFGQELSKAIEGTSKESFIKSVSFYKTSIMGNDTNYFYDHKLKSGVCSISDAIKVAKSAGFPSEALETAESILGEL